MRLFVLRSIIEEVTCALVKAFRIGTIAIISRDVAMTASVRVTPLDFLIA